MKWVGIATGCRDLLDPVHPCAVLQIVRYSVGGNAVVLKQNGQTRATLPTSIAHEPVQTRSSRPHRRGYAVRRTACGKSRRSSKPASSSKQKKQTGCCILAAMGPGIVTAMAGNDAGGISTYSTVGAKFGFATLWVIPIMCVLLIVVEMTAAQHGCGHRQGLRRAHPRIASASGSRRWPCSRCSSATLPPRSPSSQASPRGMEMFGVSKYIAGARRRGRRVAAHRRRQLQTRGESVP